MCIRDSPYSIHVLYSLFPQSLSKFSLVYLLAWHSPLHTSYISFRNTCPYHCNLFCCSTNTMSSKPSLPLNSLLGTLSCNFTPNIHLTILISALWSAASFSFLTGQVSLPCNILLRTQLLYNLPLTVNDISLLVSNGTNCLNLFRPVRDIINYFPKFKDRDHAHLRYYLSIQRLILHMTNQCSNFEVFCFSHSRDILGGLKISNGSHDVTTPFSGTVCRSLAGTCYVQPAHQIWSLCVHPLRRYEMQCKM